MEIAELQRKAERLAALRAAIIRQEEDTKKVLEPLKAERDTLQDEILQDMANEKVATLRVESGDMYTRSIRKGIAVTSEPLARKWAMENNAFSIDRRQVAQQLAKAEEMPAGFERVETPYISIRKNKEQS